MKVRLYLFHRKLMFDLRARHVDDMATPTYVNVVDQILCNAYNHPFTGCICHLGWRTNYAT